MTPRRKTASSLAALRRKISRISGRVHKGQYGAILDFVFQDGLFFIEMINTQDCPLFDIQIGFNKNFKGVYGTKVISELQILRQIPFLAPKKSIRIFLDSSSSYFQRREPTLIRSGILYKNADKQIFFDEITHDLSIYREIGCVKIQPAKSSASLHTP